MSESYTTFLVILLGLGPCSFVNELNPTVYAQSPSVTNSTAEDYFNRGKQKVESNPKEAIADLSDSIRLNPNNPSAYYQRGIARYNLISDAYDEEPGGFGVWLKAEALQEEAIADLTKSIQLKPNFIEAFYTRGLVRGPRNPASLQDFDQVIRLNPKLAEAYHNRGIIKFINALNRNGRADWSEAKRDFTRAVQLNSDLSEAYYGLGFSISGMGSGFKFSDPELIKGNPVFLQMLRLKPTIQPGNYWLPLPEDYQKIVENLSQLIQQESQNADLYYRRGFAYLKSRDTQVAIRDFNTVIQFQPEDADAYYGRGYSYYRLKNLKQAVLDLNKAIQINPKNPDTYFLQGLIHLGLTH